MPGCTHHGGRSTSVPQGDEQKKKLCNVNTVFKSLIQPVLFVTKPESIVTVTDGLFTRPLWIK